MDCQLHVSLVQSFPASNDGKTTSVCVHQKPPKSQGSFVQTKSSNSSGNVKETVKKKGRQCNSISAHFWSRSRGRGQKQGFTKSALKQTKPSNEQNPQRKSATQSQQSSGAEGGTTEERQVVAATVLV